MRFERWGALVLTVALALGASGCGSDDNALRADAGDDFSVPVGGSPVFDGCGSSGAVSYTWTIVEAPPSMSQDTGKVIRATAPECSFTLEAAMLADEAGRWLIELTVADSSGGTSTDTVTVEVAG